MTTHQEFANESTEMYLKEIYLLTEGGTPARTGELAERLDVSAPSVSEKLGDLAEQGLVAREKYRGAELTTGGEAAARALLQKHCLIERFLVDVLGVEEGFHEEACRIEHAMSDEVADRLDEIVDRPRDCPTCYDAADQHCATLFAGD